MMESRTEDTVAYDTDTAVGLMQSVCWLIAGPSQVTAPDTDSFICLADSTVKSIGGRGVEVNF
jgi:hypothetical protein